MIKNNVFTILFIISAIGITIFSFFPQYFLPENESFFVGSLKSIEERGNELLFSIDKNGEKIVVPVYGNDKETEFLEWTQGTKIMIQKQNNADTIPEYTIVGIYFIPWILSGITLFSMLLISLFGISVIRPFISLAISIAYISFVLLPALLSGGSIFLYGILGIIGISIASIVISHGYNRVSLSSALSSLITFIGIFIISSLVIHIFHLWGYGGSNISYLIFDYPSIDLQGIFLIGIFIGGIGVIDDVVVAQASAIEEIYSSNPKTSFEKLFNSGMKVGKAHMFSMINTLFFAYVGTNIALYIALSVLEKPWWVLVNTPFIQEEMVRIFIGSIGIFMAIPIASLITSGFIVAHKKIPKENKGD